MAAPLRFIAFSCIVFLAVQQMATGLKCYQCYSCKNPTNLVTVGSDASGYSCTKVTTMIGGQLSDVTRGSSATNICYEYNTVVDGTGYFQNCCAKDGCNGGITLLSSLRLTCALIAIVIFKSIITN